MRCNDSYGVCRICMKEAGLALQSSFSSLPLISCYAHHRRRDPTLRYTRAHFGLLRLIGASTNTQSEHKTSFSISPGHVPRSLKTITLLISPTSSWNYWATVLKDRHVHVS